MRALIQVDIHVHSICIASFHRGQDFFFFFNRAIKCNTGHFHSALRCSDFELHYFVFYLFLIFFLFIFFLLILFCALFINLFIYFCRWLSKFFRFVTRKRNQRTIKTLTPTHGYGHTMGDRYIHATRKSWEKTTTLLWIWKQLFFRFRSSSTSGRQPSGYLHWNVSTHTLADI